MRVRFTADYNHRWPSRAATHFLAGYEGRVKREVGEAAIAKGKATELPPRDSVAADERRSIMGRSRDLARHDHADDVGPDDGLAELGRVGQ